MNKPTGAAVSAKLTPKILTHEFPKIAFNQQHFLVEPSDSFKARTNQLSQRAFDLGKVKIPQIIPHVGVSLAQYQTPIRNQQDRGTCFSFAGVAALEAFYKRKYGLNLDLSEQYIFSMEKCGELYGDYVTSTVPHENNSSFWGFQGNSGILEIMQRVGIPEEGLAPYQTESQLDALRQSLPASGALDWNSTQEQLDTFEYSEKNIPRDARWNAKYRVTNWQATGGNPSTDDLEKILSAGHEVVVDLDLKWKWDSSQNAYDYDPTSGGGGHVVLLIGYDKTAGIFTAKNSWGGTSYLQMTYNFIKNCCGWGHYITDVADPKSPPQRKAWWVGNWNMDHDGWRGQLVIRRFTNYRESNETAPTKLGDYYRDGKRHDVNGYFVDDGQGVVFWIADGTNRIQPGQQTGQRFDIFVFSWDAGDAAGKTSWQNTPFGALLKRDAVPFLGGGAFQVNDWIGHYKMNHDGWQGELTIQSVAPHFAATYKSHDGKMLPVTGGLGAKPHELTIHIKFDPSNNQQFDLLHHTWEKGIFSGTTYWGGRTFGVQGFKT